MRRFDGTEIAVVGLSGRFPGAPDVTAFWSNLRSGVESLSHFSDDQLLAEGVRPRDLALPSYVKAGCIIDDRARFDAAFFEIPPEQAVLMDPQQRHFLECCWGALEHAGYAPRHCERVVGVYSGSSTNAYLLFNLWPRLLSDPEAGFDTIVSTLMANASERVPTRVSYKLDLRGPSIDVHSACSTSLVAVHLACQGLLALECDMALAGGTSFGAGYGGHRFLRDGMFSSDGHCRTFDARAEGTTGGSGVGVVVLKRLEDALKDRDTIHALILGSAVNNDGDDKIGYAAPSVEGQRRVILSALGVAGVSPDSIGYIEAHGTATPLGDPIEVRAITRAYRQTSNRTAYCAIGSVKANIGHLDAAAGVAGLIKAILAVKHGELPPSVNYTSSNPQIPFEDSPVFVNQALRPWVSEGPRRAAVSALGIGGTNAHVIIEQPPRPEDAAPAAALPERPWQILCLSARTQTALARSAKNLRDHLDAHRELSLADVAFTLQRGRTHLACRQAIVCPRGDAPLAALARADETSIRLGRAEEVRPIFVFSGNRARGGGPAGVLAGLPDGLPAGLIDEPDFLNELARCERALLAGWALDLGLGLGLGEHRPKAPAARAFAVQAAVARLLLALGVTPRGLIGEDLTGDCVAAYVSGVFRLEDAMAIVLAGDPPPQATLASRLASALLSAPALPVLDPATETAISTEKATDPSYWVDRLGGALPAIAPSERAGVLVDIGEGPRVGAEAGQGRSWADGLGDRRDRYVATSPPNAPDANAGFTAALARLWTLGVDIDWPRYHRGREGRRIPLPTYPFEGQDYWQPAATPQAPVTPSNAAAPRSWLSMRSWRRDAHRRASPSSTRGTSWLIFMDDAGAGASLQVLLEASGAKVATASIATGRDADGAEDGERGFDLTRPRETAAALQRLVQRARPQYLVYLWSLAQPASPASPGAAPEAAPEAEHGTAAPAAEALWLLGRIVAMEPRTTPLSILVATRNLLEVHGGEPGPSPASWFARAGRIVTNQAASVRCRVVDMDEVTPDCAGRLIAEAMDEAMGHVRDDVRDDVVAWRGRYRWLPALGDVAPREKPARDPLHLVVAGLDRLEDLAMASAVGEALPSGSRVHLAGDCPVPRRALWARWERWRDGSGETLAAEAEAQAEVIALLPRSPLASLDFAAQCAAIEGDARRLHAEQAERYADAEGFLAGADTLCARWALDHVRAIGVDTRPGATLPMSALVANVLPEFHKFTGFLVEILRREGIARLDEKLGDELDGGRVTFLAHALPEASVLRRTFLAAHPAFEAWCELVERCVRAYPDVFSGRVHPHEVLYPGGSHELLRQMERRVPDITNRHACHRTLLQIVERLSRATNDRLRIVEVGAGTGIVTWDLVERLAGRPIDYVFTDIGRSFVVEAEREAARRGIDGMRFATLDISRDPESQGMPCGSADIVVAFNVVQATPHVAETLGHLRSLLAPGGVLLMMNTVRDVHWYSMVFGLANGWWDFADQPLRRHSPILSTENWQEVMTQQGFEDVRAFPADPRQHRAILLGVQRDLPRGRTPGDVARGLGDAIRAFLALEDKGVAVLPPGEDPPDSAVDGAVDGVVLFEDAPAGDARPASWGRALAARRQREAQCAAWNASFQVRIERGARPSGERFAPRANDAPAGWSTVDAGAISGPQMAALLGEILPPACDAANLVVDEDELARWLGGVAGIAGLGPTPGDLARPGARTPEAQRARGDAHRGAGSTTQGELERAISAMWGQVLGVSPIDAHTYFFDVGGDSLAGLQLQARIEMAYGVELGLTELLANATVAGIASLIEARIAERPDEPRPEPIPVLAQQGDDVQHLIDEIAALSEDEVLALMNASPAKDPA